MAATATPRNERRGGGVRGGVSRGRGGGESDPGAGDGGDGDTAERATSEGRAGSRHRRRFSCSPRPPTGLADGFGRGSRPARRVALHPSAAVGPRSAHRSVTGTRFGGVRRV